MTGIFNEMEGKGGAVREPYARIAEWLKTLSRKDVDRAVAEAEAIFRRQGITFNVYGDAQAAERLIPFDIVPRVFAASEWRKLSAGIEQRVRALNAFIHDLYHRQEILRAGRIPHEIIIQNEAFVPEMVGVSPRVASMPTSSASTSCGWPRTSSTCSRTIAAHRRACPTCSRTARR